MKIVVLVDNIGHEDCAGEWGLSVYVEYNGEKLLLDTGTTGAFAENAAKLGINIEDVSYGILSHAHYDHSDGMESFFAQNQSAKFYLRRGCSENCYSEKDTGLEYIGIHKGFLERYKDRIVHVDGDYTLLPGVKLIPHKTPDLETIGRNARMFVMEQGELVPDSFCHEQSLVFETEKGLVIFNSCCHGGADNIIREVADTFPDKRVYAIIGGFHLFRSGESEVRAFAERIRQTGIQRIVTGHCTGEAAFRILKEELGDTATQMYAGMTLNI